LAAEDEVADGDAVPAGPGDGGASAPTVSWCKRLFSASAISVVSHTSNAFLPAAVSDW
jgi:hypothetical protein